MQLFPAIDVKDGKCVRLYKGLFDKKTVYSENPYEIAKKWESLGATYIHVVDLDGALNGNWTNKKAISDIVNSVSIPVQTGGGIRTIQDIEIRLNAGIDRVIIGTMAVKNPDFVKEAVQKFGSDKIVVGIDAKGGMVATHGWEQVSKLRAVEFAKQMKTLGVNTVVYTDIMRDGTMEGVNLVETKELIQQTKMDIIASGGIATLEDLKATNEIGSFGTIIGKALYEETVDLKQAIELFQK